MAIILQLLRAVCLILVSSRMVDSFSNHPHNSFRKDMFKKLKFSKQQGTRSRSGDRG